MCIRDSLGCDPALKLRPRHPTNPPPLAEGGRGGAHALPSTLLGCDPALRLRPWRGSYNPAPCRR
eukprot:12212350-Alexandrium_andersonii.AAC.1